jgi:competence protein ComEC
LKSRYGVQKLDEVIITHPHRDHIDDILNFAALSPRTLMRPRHLTEDEIRQGNQGRDDEYIDKYIEIDNQYGTDVPRELNPQLAENNGGVSIQTFIPKSCDPANLNNQSLVTVVEYATSKMILPGDNEPESWVELLEQEAFCRAVKGADILLAPHHGRESGYCAELFDMFKPKLTVISDGPCESSVSSRYSAVSTGWKVHSRAGGPAEDRCCVTTRSDDVILVKFGYDDANNPFMYVSIA